MKVTKKQLLSLVLTLVFLLTAAVPMLGFDRQPADPAPDVGGNPEIVLNPGIILDPEVPIDGGGRPGRPPVDTTPNHPAIVGIILRCPTRGEIEMPYATVEFVPSEGIIQISDPTHGIIPLEYGMGFGFMQLGMGYYFVEKSHEAAVQHALENGLPLHDSSQYAQANSGHQFWIQINHHLVPAGTTTTITRGQWAALHAQINFGHFMHLTLRHNTTGTVSLDEIFSGTVMASEIFPARMDLFGMHTLTVTGRWFNSWDAISTTRNINVPQPPRPAAPRNLEVSINGTNATIAWSVPTHAVGYEIAWMDEHFSNYGVPVRVGNTTFLRLENLRANSRHFVRIRARNAQDDYGNWSCWYEFRTGNHTPRPGINVTVVDSAGRPIQGAVVHFVRRQTSGQTRNIMTDINGVALYENAPVGPHGTYGINVTHRNFLSTQATSTTISRSSSGQIQSVRITMNEHAATFRNLGWVNPIYDPGTPAAPRSRITSVFGWRSFFNTLQNTWVWQTHTGIDLVRVNGNTSGHRLNAPFDGQIVRIHENIDGLGWGITMRFQSATMGNFYVRYAHMRERPHIIRNGVRTNLTNRDHINMRINSGEHIGTIGSTGNSTDAHLHIDVSRINNFTFANTIDPQGFFPVGAFAPRS
ncbi:MAG: peptidoglycan DD-metalloendopeptidase family protein [Oscillospiraceae bacterium]|nr:peptidoglycan DD-metalloendopeptidase family protein [Oscillospiraceae bacterium]